jgi:hypothetical protein
MTTILPTYPLGLRDTPPGPGYVRMPISPHEGFHTGGPWLHPDQPDVIWKPLDARPFAPVLVATREAEVLELLADQPGFPSNWQLDERNGRRWLIRRRAVVLGPVEPPTRGEAFTIEAALRILNAAGWSMHDHVTVARDPDTSAVFVLDLSAAAPEPIARFRSDSQAWCRWVREVGYSDLADLRVAARKLAGVLRVLHPERRDLKHIYACTGADLVELPAGALLEVSRDPRAGAWLLAGDPLDDATCERLGLEWGWSLTE